MGIAEGADRVTEAEAEGKVKAAFEDIRATLGVETAGDLFEHLAAHPAYFLLAWRHLKPNAAIAYFHRMAWELEDMAFRSTGLRRRSGTGEQPTGPDEARLDLDSKLLAAAGALRYGANGQVPKMLWLSAQDKQVVEPSASRAMPASEPAPAADGRAARELRRRAALMAESLPYRMEISSSACRQSGLSEDEIDTVRALIDLAWDELPRRVLAAAGAAGGVVSPEPVEAA